MASVHLLALSQFALLLGAVLLIIHLLRNRFKPILRDIPGPPLAGYTSLWRTFVAAGGQMHERNIQWHRKYGPLVRFAPNVISVGDPAMIPLIYTIKGEYTKTAFYPIQSPFYNGKPQSNIFVEPVVSIHREMRRRVAHTYSLNYLLRMEDQVNDVIGCMCERLAEFAERGDPFDFGSWLQYFAFDVIGELTISQKFGFLEKGTDVDDILKTITGIITYAAIVGQAPILHKLLLGNPLLPILFPKAVQWHAIENYTMGQIHQRAMVDERGELRIQEGKEARDMISGWATNPRISTQDIVLNASGNVVAGSDTTAIAMRSVFYHLLKNPSTLARLQREIDEADKAGKLSSTITHKEALNELPYLDAVIKEAMRKHPSFGLILERHVPEGGATICGRHIPGGTIVGINSWVAHHDPHVFPSPDKFEPERWLATGEDGDKERLARMEQAWVPFGAGSRTCLGRNIALLEIRKVVPEILRRFDIALADGQDWQSTNIWFVTQKMPKCIVKSRGRKS